MKMSMIKSALQDLYARMNRLEKKANIKHEASDIELHIIEEAEEEEPAKEDK